MKAAQVSHQLGHASHSLFATSLGASVVLHGLAIVWMLSGSGPSRVLLADLPAFHSVSLVNAPGSPPVAEPVASVPEPQAIPEPASVPVAVDPIEVPNVEPETTVQPPQAKEATEVPETSVEPPAPVAKPEPVQVPEAPSVVDTQVEQPKPVKAAEERPVPAPTPPSASGPTVAPTEVAAAPPGTTPAQPRAAASRNSPQAAQRAREAIENLRAQSGQGTSTSQSPGGVAVGMQELLLRTYEQRVRARIINAWHLPIPEKMAQGLRAVALLTIDREGQVIRYELTRSSGDPSFDASLSRAVQASSPLPELPDTYTGEILEAEIHFAPPASS